MTRVIRVRILNFSRGQVSIRGRGWVSRSDYKMGVEFRGSGRGRGRDRDRFFMLGSGLGTRVEVGFGFLNGVGVRVGFQGRGRGLVLGRVS